MPLGFLRHPNLRICAICLDVFGQHIVNFVVPGNRLFLAGGRIQIDVVPSAMPQQDAALPKQFPNQFITLQIEISMV